MTNLRDYFEQRTPQWTEMLCQLVEIESPSQDQAGVNRVGDQVRLWMEQAGAQVERLPGKRYGDMILGSWQAGLENAPILLLCHMDTVWALGTLAQRPLRIEDGKLYGPGAYDMKSGIVIALAALQGLAEMRLASCAPVLLLCTADEETGSHESRLVIEDLARRSQLVLCLEPALPGGVVKTARKGVGGFRLRVVGRPAHAGADHQKGINAIQEMAHQVLALQALTDYTAGTTVNVGVIQGGTVSNVVPAECTARVDFRVANLAEAERLQGSVKALQPHLPGAELIIRGGINRPPMERNALMAATFEKASKIAGFHGIELREGSTGGGSDANFTAALGIPTLDGLGAEGDGGHALHEHVLLSSLAERATLLAMLLAEWC